MKKQNKAQLKKTPSPARAEEDADKKHFPIVGVGASAGGLEAFSQFLASLREDSGMAYVLVQHLDPHHETRLSELLSKKSHLPIREATHGLVVRPDHVYVIPPNTSMTIRKGVLRLAPRNEAETPFLPIDHFLFSLATEQKNRAIGVILSGTGTDGTKGLEEIKAEGGITFAQEQATAKFPAMPESAIQTGCVDFILPADKIGPELSRISQHPYMEPEQAQDGKAGAGAGAGDEQKHYKKILALVRANAGVDFTSYRDKTIKRRLLRRMALHTKHSLSEYIDFVKDNPEEIEALYHDLLINVTSFFRDPDTFEALKDSVLPELLKAKRSEPLIRVWVPGCSTGQEAYSLAIILMEFLDEKGVHGTIKIFATDLSEENALKKAREGLYPDSIEQEVSPERLQRFFTKEGDKYRINKSIREMCVFAKHNVAVDPPFSRMDLVSCRNLLIYLAQPLQQKVIPTFHYALNRDGFLLLGTSETIGKCTNLFSVVDRSLRIYRKKVAVMQQYPHFSTKGDPTPKDTSTTPATVSNKDWQREADRILLSKYTPAGVLINDDYNILQFRGKTSPYLEMPPGEPSHNLMRIAAEGLFPGLRIAVEKCAKQNKAVTHKGMQVRKDDQIREIDIQVTPVTLPNSDESCFLVLFEEAATPAKPTKPSAKKASEADEVAQLRQELSSMHTYMQRIIEEKDEINEELKATNEEFLSSNEELQSTNEELETAKEELQSVNEELTTVNEQLHSRNKELDDLNGQLQDARDDAEAIIKTVHTPLIVLDADLRVQQANPAFYRDFQVTKEETKNCLIFELGNGQWDIPELRRMLEDILPYQKTLTDFEVNHRFKTIGDKTMLLNAQTMVRYNGEPPLVLLAIEDISERKSMEKKLRKSSERLAKSNRDLEQFAYIVSHDLKAPLRAVKQLAKWLEEDLEAVLDEDSKESMQTIRSRISRMEKMMDDLLAYSRVGKESDKETEEVVMGDVLLKDTLTLINPPENLTINIPPIFSHIKVKRMPLQQVFLNLISNAIKHNDKEKCIITVGCKEEPDHYLFSVEDNGPGIAKKDQKKIFEMFQQVKSRDEIEGSGIGLAIVKKAIKAQGGEIFLTSQLGKSTTFSFTWPRLDQA